MTKGPDATARLWRACRRIEPGRKARSAALFITLYLAAVAGLGALLSTLAGAAAGA